MTESAEPLTAWAGRPVDTLRIEWGVPTLLAFDSVASTNDIARSLASSGAAPFTTILADRQTAGRGRRGRSWIAPAGTALLCSILLRPRRAWDLASSATPIRVGLAVARAIERATGAPVLVKWPNDVLAPDRRKLAGVLCEAAQGPHGHHVVAGVGINVSQRADEWPDELRGLALSLAELAGTGIDRAALAGALIAELKSGVADLDRPLSVAECNAWHDRDALLGRTIRVDDGEIGTAEGITPEGALRFRDQAGPRILWAGTVRTLDHDTTTAAAIATDREEGRR
jgi:BirA family transcriptional regulator, biotin operon repressor / biotin---[acetyl-CoA-carboxylase] ligase